MIDIGRRILNRNDNDNDLAEAERAQRQAEKEAQRAAARAKLIGEDLAEWGRPPKPLLRAVRSRGIVTVRLALAVKGGLPSGKGEVPEEILNELAELDREKGLSLFDRLRTMRDRTVAVEGTIDDHDTGASAYVVWNIDGVSRADAATVLWVLYAVHTGEVALREVVSVGYSTRERVSGRSMTDVAVDALKEALSDEEVIDAVYDDEDGLNGTPFPES